MTENNREAVAMIEVLCIRHQCFDWEDNEQDMLMDAAARVAVVAPALGGFAHLGYLPEALLQSTATVDSYISNQLSIMMTGIHTGGHHLHLSRQESDRVDQIAYAISRAPEGLPFDPDSPESEPFFGLSGEGELEMVRGMIIHRATKVVPVLESMIHADDLLSGQLAFASDRPSSPTAT